MELTFRAAAPAERLYIARQSTQIEGQTGSVGHLQADMGEDGKGFFPKWTSHRESLDTEDFQQEFEEVLEALVGDEQYGGFLKSRDAMRDFCRGHQESGYDSGFAFGFRADTAQYLIGTGHKEFKADKTGDDDYYILTLAAIARELNVYGLTDATVYLAVGLPLTWVSRQRADFKAYLMRNRELAFTFRGKAYRVEIAGVDVFPQGFAAVAGQIRDFQGVNMLCDIGNGTMNIMFINDRKPVVDRMFTEKYGTHQCMLAVRENVMRTHHATVDESIINRVLRFGTADIREDYLTTIRETAAEYVGEIFRILREREYNPALMRLHVLGGGSCLVRNFGAYDADRVTIYEDICATAKGYEFLCEQALHRGVSG